MEPRGRFSLAVIPAIAVILSTVLSPGPAIAAGTTTQSSISAYVSCPTGVGFAAPGASGSCSSGNFTASGTYTGVSQVIGAAQDSVFYLSSVAGGVKVIFNLTDVTTGQTLFWGAGYGALSGGTCSSPGVVTPASTDTHYAADAVSSGDVLRISLDLLFTASGSSTTLPTFCSGGSSATLISVDTTVASGTSATLTTTLRAGASAQTTLSGINGVTQAYTYASGPSTTAIVIGTLKNSAGVSVDVISTSIVLNSGQTVTAFLPFYKQYASGSYTLTIVAITSAGVPMSTSTVTGVTI